MRSDQERYIISNLDKKTPQQLARELGISERKINRFIRMRRLSPKPALHTGIDDFLAVRFSEKQLLVFSALIIAFVTALVFLPALSNNFVTWDDPEYVYENPLIRTFTPENIKNIFTSSFQGAYCPITILSYSLEYGLAGNTPFIYHFTNYILHIGVTLLTLIFIYRISGNVFVAFFTALFFGIHPVHVESVAWIAERKDVLYALFYMLSILAYQRYLSENKIGRYLLCLTYAVLSFFSKPMAITLPAVLFLMDYVHKRKLGWAMVAEKIPFFIIGAGVGMISYRFQVLSGVTKVGSDTLVRVYFLLKEIPFYLSKLLLPYPLVPVYKYYNVGPSHIPELYFNAIVLLSIGVFVIFSARRTRTVVFCALFFLITASPVLKVIPVADTFAADRYMYIPSIGVFFLLSLAVKKYIFDRRYNASIRVVCTLVLSAWILLLSCRTIEQCGVWKNTETFFLHILRHGPDIPTANNNLGLYYLEREEYDKAIIYLERAIENNPAPVIAEMARSNLAEARSKKDWQRHGMPVE